jgi:hypothetical protein
MARKREKPADNDDEKPGPDGYIPAKVTGLTASAFVDLPAVLSKRTGRHRHPVRDEICIVVSRHIERRSDWSKLLRKEFAAKIGQQFKGAVSDDQIEEIIRLAFDKLSQP